MLLGGLKAGMVSNDPGLNLVFFNSSQMGGLPSL